MLVLHCIHFHRRKKSTKHMQTIMKIIIIIKCIKYEYDKFSKILATPTKLL